MDEMKITSTFTRGIVSRLITKMLCKKLGYDIGIQVNDLQATVIDGRTRVHLDADIDIEKEELMKILKNIG